MMKKLDYILLTFAIGVFLIFQVILMRYVHLTDYDEAVFLNIVRNIQRIGMPMRSIGLNGVFYFDHTPLYPYLVAASVSLVGDSPNWARLVTTQFAIATIILTYLTVRREQTAVSSFVAALLLALNTFIAIYAYFLTMAVPMMFFILLAIYWLSKDGGNPSWRYWFGAGIAAALAVMLKELALIFIFAAMIYAFVFGRNWKERITHPLWLSLPTAVSLAMWAWWGMSLGQPQFQSALMRWVNSASGANNAAGARALETLSWVQALGNTVFSWGMLALFIMVIPAYFIWFRRKLPQITWLLFLYLGIATALSFFISLKEPRHVIALIPMMAMIIGIMIPWESVWNWVRGKPVRIIVTSLSILFLAWSISPLKVPPTDQWRHIETWWEPSFAHRAFHAQRYYSILRDTGQYLSENTSPDTIITVMHEGPIIGYYADRSHQFLYTMSYARVLETLEGAEYVVVDNKSFFHLTPEEIEFVMTYIETEFELEQLVKNDYREVNIYHRRY